MQSIRDYLLFLWNGGLDTQTAGLIELRERRILSSSIILLAPAGLVIMVSNIFTSGSIASADNIYILCGLLLVFSALFIQAYIESKSIAANIAVFAFWMIPTLVMQSYGVQGTTIMWLLPIPAFATLINGRHSGIFWAIVCCLTAALYGHTHASGNIAFSSPHDVYRPAAGIPNAIEAVVLIIILTGSAYIFRKAQFDTEVELKKLVNRLETEVHNRTLAEEDAKLSEQSKTAFLSAMSHEIRTPLNGVITATRLLVDAKNDSDRREFSDIVIDSSNTLMELVSDVMDLTAMESGKLKIANKPIAIRELIRTTLRPFQFQAEEKGIKLDIETAPTVPAYIIGDATRAKQILINLVGNAIKFTNEGSVKVTTTIELNKLKLVVEDTGIGIPVEAQSKLFEPFVQADVTTRGNFGGSGLGLTIVKKIVNAVNGKIQLESTPGRGTKFSAYFPLVIPDTINAAEAAESNEDIILAPLNLLIADDNAVNRMVLGRLLENDNHKVVSVVDGKQALDYIKAHRVDAVLMDIQMPVMNGEEAAASIRQLSGPHRDTPIIAITANTSREDAARLLQSDFDGFVAKPFRHEELMKTLHRVCNSELIQ